jgi:cell division initiation protein
MRLTPLDVRNQRFATRFRGYDPDEVDAFLRMVAEDYESIAREAEGLRDTVVRLETRIEALTAEESTLRTAVVSAQHISEDLKRTAVKESEAMIGEAEVRAEKILDAAHRRAAKIREDIRELKVLRSHTAAAVRTTLEAHLALLEGIGRDTPEEEAFETKVAYLAPPARAAAAGEGA